MRHKSYTKFVTILLSIVLVACGTTKRKVTETPRQSEQIAVKEEPTEVLKEAPVNADVFTVMEITSTEQYIETFSAIAQEEMRQYGIPASITIAQGILESGSGKGELTKKTNNHFGIKCHQGWEGDRDYHDDDAAGECFRKYNHPVYSFRDHSVFLSSRARYSSLFDLRRDNYIGWARGLKKAGYATDPKYPQKVISIIERYELYKYDREVMKEGNLALKRKPVETTWVNYVVQQGDTLYGISMKYNVTIDEIKSLNGLTGNTISVGQLLILKTPISSK